MHAVAKQLDETLNRLDAAAAAELERAVREVLEARAANAAPASGSDDPWAGVERDAMGYPEGYFERTAGSFANEPLERPPQPPLEERADW